MIRLFTTRISFVWNLMVIYAYNFYYGYGLRVQEPVVLFDNVHTTSTHTIVDFTLGNETRSVIFENPKEFTGWDILSVYDRDHAKDLTSQFKRFAGYYNTETKSFQFLEAIKQFLNTSDNIVIIDNELDEHQLEKTSGSDIV